MVFSNISIQFQIVTRNRNLELGTDPAKSSGSLRIRIDNTVRQSSLPVAASKFLF
jgi:hypothetical protein